MFGDATDRAIDILVYLERKKGRTITLIVGESARNCRLMESLRADTRKYGIKVYGDIS